MPACLILEGALTHCLNQMIVCSYFVKFKNKIEVIHYGKSKEIDVWIKYITRTAASRDEQWLRHPTRRQGCCRHLDAVQRSMERHSTHTLVRIHLHTHVASVECENQRHIPATIFNFQVESASARGVTTLTVSVCRIGRSAELPCDTTTGTATLLCNALNRR